MSPKVQICVKILDENNVECDALSPATFYDCEVMYEKGEHQRALERMIAFMEKIAEKHGIEV